LVFVIFVNKRVSPPRKLIKRKRILSKIERKAKWRLPKMTPKAFTSYDKPVPGRNYATARIKE
jgi:hypothetical protein